MSIAGQDESLQIHVLASGSSGNATLVVHGSTAFLIDAGISARRITQGIKSFGIMPDQLAGVFITHEHSDHIAGLPQLIKQYDLPIFTKKATMSEIIRRKGLQKGRFTALTGSSMAMGSLTVEYFSTSHDAIDPIGLEIIAGSEKATYMTDTGIIDANMLGHMDDSRLLVLEANYDPQMLCYGPYPADLKRRVAGSHGHLSNESAARALIMMKRPAELEVIMAHRSEHNNAQPVVTDTLEHLLTAEGIVVGDGLTVKHGQPKEAVSIGG